VRIPQGFARTASCNNRVLSVVMSDPVLPRITRHENFVRLRGVSRVPAGDVGSVTNRPSYAGIPYPVDPSGRCDMYHLPLQPLVLFHRLSRSPRSGARVLVVDDDPSAQRLMAVLLKEAGFSVVAASRASEAIAAYKTAKFDLAVIDIVLPDVRGDELLTTLRSVDESSRRLPAIAVTGYGSYVNQERVRQAGFDAYFVKPTDFGRLLDKIAELIRARGL
jgi:CheY-like chemotaxis protein